MAKYVAQGLSGTKGRPRLRKDILAMRDEKKLEGKVAAKQKQIRRESKAPRSSRLTVEGIMAPTRSRQQKIRRLRVKAAQMRNKARKVDESKTGNVKAAATYRRVAAEYLKQAAALQGKK